MNASMLDAGRCGCHAGGRGFESTPPTSFSSSTSADQISARTSGAIAGGHDLKPSTPSDSSENAPVVRSTGHELLRTNRLVRRLAWHPAGTSTAANHDRARRL